MPQSLVSPSQRSLKIGTISYFGATFFWGMNIPLTAVLLSTWDPYFLALIRVLLATVTFAIVVLISENQGLRVVGISLGRLCLAGGAFACFLLLYNMGLKFSDPITAAAIMAGTPVYAAITLRLVTGSPLEKGFVVAATLTVVGGAIALFAGQEKTASAGVRGGEVFILLSFVFWNLYTIATQRWFEASISQLRRTMSCFAVASVWIALGWVMLRWSGIAPEPNLEPGTTAIALLFITATLATAGGVLLWNIGVAQIGLATGSLWQNMVPIFGVLIAALLGFIPSMGQVVGGLVVLSGVLWMQWKKSTT
ncbi:MAG: DMT family transporter [Burkholderiaceae bacterium]